MIMNEEFFDLFIILFRNIEYFQHLLFKKGLKIKIYNQKSKQTDNQKNKQYEIPAQLTPLDSICSSHVHQA